MGGKQWGVVNFLDFEEQKNRAALKPLAFPDEVMSGAAGRFATTYAQYLEPPPHFFYFSYLTLLGSYLSGLLLLESELKLEPRLFTILLGLSGTARKSTAADKTIDFFLNTLPHSVSRFLEDRCHMAICQGAGSAEGLAKYLMSKADRVLLWLDEFKTFVSKCKIDTSALLSMVTTLFESTSYQNSLKSNDIQVKNGHLSLLACSTTEVFQACFDSRFQSVGFSNRLFIVPGESERKYSVPPKMPEFERELLAADLEAVVAFVGKGRTLTFTPEALAIWDDYYKNLESSIHAIRLDTYGLRLALLLAVNEKRESIDTDIVRKVISILHWELGVRKQYDPIDADSALAIMEERIRRVMQMKHTVKERELARLTNAHRAGLWVFHTAIQNLVKYGEIEWKPKKTLKLIRGGANAA